MQLSNFDLKLLSAISREGVGDIPRLSSMLRVSEQTLNYKIRKFEANKVILSYRYRLDYRKIGLRQIEWIFLTIKDKTVDIERLLDKLLELPQVHLCLCITGEFDIAAKVFAEDIDSITRFTLDLERRFADEIKSTSVFFTGRLIKWHHKLIEENPERFRLDKTGLGLLSYKLLNTEASIEECAKKAGVHRNTASAKWNAFSERGVIIKKSAIINEDYSKGLGTSFKMIVFITSETGKTEELAKKVAALDEVHELNLISHPSDLMAIVRTSGVESFYGFLMKLHKNKEFNKLISSTRSVLILSSQARKHTYLKDLPEEIFLGEN